MNLRTALPAVALLALVALAAPSAQAAPIHDALETGWEIENRIIECYGNLCRGVGGEPCDKEAVGFVCDLGNSIEVWCDGDCTIGDPTNDYDHDLVPDSVERNYCGRSYVRGFNAHVETAFTRCNSKGDVSGLADGDRDGIPDFMELLLCGLEDQNTDLDGSCNPEETDYTL